MRLRAAALRRRLVLIAVSSFDRIGKRCWSELKRDSGANIASILREFVSREGLQELPLYAMGASSGGQMALTLPLKMSSIAGVYSQVRGVENPEKIFKLPKGKRYPPVAFVHMPRDEHNLAIISNNIDVLTADGIEVLEIRISPRPVTAEFLSERSPMIDLNMGTRIVDALYAVGIATPNGTLLEPPRPATSRWAPSVQPIVGNQSLKLDESHVGELLNLAWANHELVSDDAEAVFAWLQQDRVGAIGLEAARMLVEAGRSAYAVAQRRSKACSYLM